MRKNWSDESIEQCLVAFVRDLRRMPTTNELRRLGANDLACAISRGHGFRWWSQKLGVAEKGTETHVGQRWERSETEFLRSLGLHVVPQTTKAPFDLLVSGKRVDVKVSVGFRSYSAPSGSVCSGYFFGGLKGGRHCDVFDLLCVDDDRVTHRFIVPSHEAKVRNLTVTPSSLNGSGKYGRFRDRTDLFR